MEVVGEGRNYLDAYTLVSLWIHFPRDVITAQYYPSFMLNTVLWCVNISEQEKMLIFFYFVRRPNPKFTSLFFFSDPPSFIDLKNQTKEIVEGVKMSLQCNVTVANPEPNITWYSATGNDTVLSNAVHLTFSNISRSNSGNYFCVAENGIGPKLTSGMITLNVQCKFIDFLLKCICNDKKKPFCYS